MLRGEDPGLGLASERPQLPDSMHPLPPHMVWTDLDTAITAHYIKLVLTFGKPITEGAPIPIGNLSL